MAEAKVVKDVAAAADKVFEILGAFDRIKAGGAIEEVRYEGQGIGMVRHIKTGAGVIVERLEEHDSQNRVMAYVIINEDCPLPFSNYASRVSVKDNGNQTCTVEWVGKFDAVGDEEAAVKTASGIYAGGIKGARIALGVD